MADTLCRECNKHEATVNFAESVLDSVHGFAFKLCKCCYFRRVEKAFNDTRANYENLKAELAEKPCGG